MKIAIKGKRYRVIKDSDGFFQPGEIVVAVEDDVTPYCVREDIYDDSKELKDYETNVEKTPMFLTDDECNELEEVED